MIRGVFTFALLLVLAGGGAAYVLGQAQPQLASGLPAVAVSSADVASFDEKVATVEAEIVAAKADGAARPVTVVFTEAELTSKATEVAASLTGGVVPTEPQIHLRRGEIVLTAAVRVQGFPLNVAVAAIPVVIEGKPSFSVVDMETSGLPLPDGVKKEIDAQLAKILSPQALGIALDVTKLEVQEGRLLIEGFARP